jgi:threonyl-tRNA synthetase
VNVRFNGKELNVADGLTFKAFLGSSGVNDEKIIAFKQDKKLFDLTSALSEGEVYPIYLDSSEGLEIIRHSAAHVMAQAVKDLYPEVKITIGPAIDSGFYYDFDYDQGFTEEDLPKIEKRMEEIIKANHPIIRRVINKSEALDIFQKAGEHYKVELISAVDDPEVSVYSQAGFTDFCRGPHLVSTGKIPAFKLLSIAGAYWRGDERNKMLTRIYGTAFHSAESLKQYLDFLEEVKKRDHRRLGKDLDLFSISDDVGAGLVIYHPNGALLRHIIEDFEKKEHLKRGYHFAKGPQILKLDMWKRSGHYENYRENMYLTKVDDVEYGLKPMNCLAHIMIFKSQIRSYRDLPLRYFELGTVNRHEKSGVLHGLLRVREFTQDDAHIFSRPDQVKDEINGVIDFVQDVMKVFGFDFEMEISTRPEHFIGNLEDWNQAESILKTVLDERSLPYDINEGDGAFYGPKIDIKLKDALGRKWQCATIQVDFALPERFDLHYTDSDGKRKRPVMLHRVVLGAIERFMGILIEHYAGKFPLWLSPIQVLILTITDEQDGHAASLCDTFRAADMRVEVDKRNEKLGLKIREGTLRKIPYLIIIGKKEMETDTISVRNREGVETKSVPINDFLDRIREENMLRR